MKKVLVILGGLLYTVSPLDLVPDVIPVLGWLDDIGVLALAIRYLTRTQEEVRTERARAAS